MMMRTVFCLMVLLFSVFRLAAQQQQPFHFSGALRLGVLKGEASEALQLQLAGGIQYKTWFVGIGAGVDNYYKRTAPVFLSFRKDILPKLQTPFLYADLGYSLPWLHDAPTEWQRSEFNKGAYLDAGIGYTFAAANAVAFNVSIGYSRKALHESRYLRSYIYRDFPPYGAEPGPERIEYYDYSLRRLSIRMGLTF